MQDCGVAVDTATMNVLLLATQKAYQPDLCLKQLRYMQKVPPRGRAPLQSPSYHHQSSEPDDSPDLDMPYHEEISAVAVSVISPRLVSILGQ